MEHRTCCTADTLLIFFVVRLDYAMQNGYGFAKAGNLKNGCSAFTEKTYRDSQTH
jgi:hypothetical protein